MNKIITTINSKTLEIIGKILEDGGVICFPTETVYALACDATNDLAVEKIYKIKGREQIKPLAILLPNIEKASDFAEIDIRTQKLSKAFGPSPISFVLKQKANSPISKLVNRDIKTIAVRVPNHKSALEILTYYSKPLIGTSLNISGQKEATKFSETLQFKPQLDLLINLEEPTFKTPSTIVDLTNADLKILRIGSISEEEILKVLEI